MDNIEMEALGRAWRYGPGTVVRRHTTLRPREAHRLFEMLGRLVPPRR